MKLFYSVFLLVCATSSQAQLNNPKAFEFSYFGETITHPGVKFGVVYLINESHSSHFKRNGVTKQIIHNINLIPSLGYYHHKNYQNGFFVLPELEYSRKSSNNYYFSCYFGIGYLYTIIPDVYELSNMGYIDKVYTDNNYLLANVGITYGRDFQKEFNAPISLYTKPQILLAAPNTAGGILYFGLELGVKYNIGD